MSPRRVLLLLLLAPLALSGVLANGGRQEQPRDGKPVRVDYYGDALPPGASARLGTARWRHGGPVFFVGLAAQGKHLVTAGQDGTFHVWELATGKEVRRFGRPHVERPDADEGDWRSRRRTVFNFGVAEVVALSPDGRLLAAEEDREKRHVRVWDVETGKELWHARHGAPATGLAFSADSKILVGQDWQRVRQWDARTGTPPHGRPEFADSGMGNIQSEAPLFAFSPDGRVLAGTVLGRGGADILRIMRLWDAASGKPLRHIREDRFQFGCLAFSPDGKHLALPSAGEGIICLWDVATGKEARRIRGTPRIDFTHALAYSPDGRILASRGYNRIIRLWDVDNGTELRPLSGPFDPAGAGAVVNGYPGGVSQGLVFSPDGKVLISASQRFMPRRWDVRTGKELPPGGGHTAEIAALVVAPDGKSVATRAADGTVRRWDRASGKELSLFRLPETAYLPALAPDGRTVAFGDKDGLRLWDVSAGREIRRWAFAGPQAEALQRGGPRALSFAADGQRLVMHNGNESVCVWDAATGQELYFLNDLRTPPEARENLQVGTPSVFVAHLVLSPDGSTLARVETTAHLRFPRVEWDGPAAPKLPPATSAVRLVHMPSGRDIRRFEVGARNVAFAFGPGGHSLATAAKDGTVSVWETATGSRRCLLHTRASTLAFAPDGKTLAVSGTGPEVQVWDLLSGARVARFAGHQGAVLSLAWTPDGTGLMSGSDDTTALVWQVPKAADVSRPLGRRDALWDTLAAPDAGRAFGAMRDLYRDPEAVVPWLREHVKPVERPDAVRLRKAIAGLNAARFATRQQAYRELEQLGELTHPALRQALADGPTLEVRRRIEELLRKQPSKALPVELLRGLRAVEVLEWLGTPQARRVLEGIADGAPGARLTREAQAALRRLSAQAAR